MNSACGLNWALVIQIMQASLVTSDHKIYKQPPRLSNRTGRHTTTAISLALWDPTLGWVRRSLQAPLTLSRPHLCLVK